MIESRQLGKGSDATSSWEKQKLQQQHIVINRKSAQKTDSKGRIVVGRMGWLLRITTIILMSVVAGLNIYLGLEHRDPLVVYATIVIIHSILVLSVGWFFYKSPAKGNAGNALVSVIIPIFSQREMIEHVINAIFRSTYQYIEVIAVNDGSKDGTKEILDNLARKYPGLRVIHKRNKGKRKAVATGFRFSTGKFIVLVDSDSIVDENAIFEFMKTFNSDPTIGALVGQAKVWNSDTNILTKCQDAWYDYAFNIYKVCESTFSSVTCCSGCLAGYRREAIADFIHYWADSKIQYSDDRALTNYAIGSTRYKKEFSPIARKLMEHSSKYDDAEDRLLTVQAMVVWKSVYVASAQVYTNAPDGLKEYLKQQQRWKKGYIRSNFFASVFFWQKHPLMSLIFYTDFMTTFTLPLVIFTVLVYEPFILHVHWTAILYLGGLTLVGFAHGLDYRFRDPNSRNWIYKPLMNLMSTFMLTWLLFPSLWSLKKNEWLTR